MCRSWAASIRHYGLVTEPNDRCWCAELPDSLPGILLTDDVRLASVLAEVSETDSVGTYRCLMCGQVWEDRFPNRAGMFKV